MPRIYKICIVNPSNESANEMFAIKPYLESFDSFKDEIFIRMPELKNQTLKIYYQGKCGHLETILRRFQNVSIYNRLVCLREFHNLLIK